MGLLKGERQDSKNATFDLSEGKLLQYFQTVTYIYDKWIKYSDGQRRFRRKEGEPIIVWLNHQLEFGLPACKQMKIEIKSLRYSLWEDGTNGKDEDIIRDSNGFVDRWIGFANDIENIVNGDVVSSGGSIQCSIERLVVYVAISNLGASYLYQAGRVEEASFELRRIADSIVALLENLLLMYQFKPDFEDYYSKHHWQSPRLHEFARFMIGQAVCCIEKSAFFSAEKMQNHGSDTQIPEMTKSLPSKLLLCAVKFGIIVSELTIKWNKPEFSCELDKQYRGNWYGEVPDSPSERSRFSYQSLVTDLAATLGQKMSKVHFMSR